MPETIDTAKEIVKIKKDIQDIKQSQEADMQFKRPDYEKLVYEVLEGSMIRVKVFLAVDNQKSMKEVQESIGENQSATSKAFDRLEQFGLLVKSDLSKDRSPIYVKPRWVSILRMDDYVRKKFPPLKTKEEDQPRNGSIDP